MQRPIIVSLAAAVLLTACSSENPFKAKYDRLNSAYGHLESGDYRRAADTAEELLIETDEDKKMYRVQRYFATYVLGLAHLSASLGKPYLQETAKRGGGVMAIGGGGSGGGGLVPSPVSHVVASVYHASNAMDQRDGAAGDQLEFEGVKKLPGGLESLGVLDAGTALELATLVAFGRLRFAESVEGTLASSPPLLELDSCEQLLEQARLPAAARPRIYLEAFRFLTRTNELEAYRFAIRARETAPQSGGSIGAEQIAGIDSWITGGSSYDFICPSCQAKVAPAVGECLNDGTANGLFIGQPKPQP